MIFWRVILADWLNVNLPYDKIYAKIRKKTMKNKNIYDIIIVGAGASGLIAAITAARQGRHVLIIEQKDKIGKKLLATGNGKCNFTNANMDLSFFHGDRTLIEEVLRQFSQEDCLSFFRELGVYPKNKNGYYYPNSEQASSVVMALELELKKLSVEVVLKETVTDIGWKKQGFAICLQDRIVIGKRVILATGLLANPKLGSDGTIFSYIKSVGHHFSKIVPALCGFYAKGIPFKKVAGVRTEAEITLYVDGTMINSDHGELQFVDYGISGIPVFQISRDASVALCAKKTCEVQINLLPGWSKEEIRRELENRCEHLAGFTAGEMLNGLLNQKLIGVVLEKAEIAGSNRVETLHTTNLEHLCEAITDTRAILTKPRDYEFAQVCAGGIRTEEINLLTLESEVVPGLYFAGELLDVDGICGGYNLQWAWSSGYVAGLSASK